MVWTGTISVFCGATVIRSGIFYHNFWLCVDLYAFYNVSYITIIFMFSDEWILTASQCLDGKTPAEIEVGFLWGELSRPTSFRCHKFHREGGGGFCGKGLKKCGGQIIFVERFISARMLVGWLVNVTKNCYFCPDFVTLLPHISI